MSGSKPTNFTPGTIVHDAYHEPWVVLGPEWDPMSGSEVYRIVHLIVEGDSGSWTSGSGRAGGGVFVNDAGEPLGTPPFTGLVGRIYPRTVANFHEPEAKP